jgi:hypothetical protein
MLGGARLQTLQIRSHDIIVVQSQHFSQSNKKTLQSPRKMSATSASTQSPSPFLLLNAPSSPTQSIATPRLYDYCYQVKTTRQSDSITSYDVNINPSSDNELPPNNIECINNCLHERTNGKAWLTYNYLSCLAGNALYQLAQDAHKTNMDIHIQIMQSNEDPNQLHANVIKAWGEHCCTPAKPASLNPDILLDTANANSELSSLPSLEAISILDTPVSCCPDSPYQNHTTWVDHSDPDSVIRAGVHKRIQEFLIDMP